MPVPPPRLVTTGTTSAVGQTLDLPADGLVLTLKLPAVAPAPSVHRRRSFVTTSARSQPASPAPGSVSSVTMITTFASTGLHAAAKNRRRLFSSALAIPVSP